MKKILLTTLNSRFTHTSIALRYLYANLKELQNDAKIIEFSINDAIQTIAEKLLTHSPQIIGIGVYIWNALEVRELIHIIKKISPNTKIVLGGPEVSHEPFRVNLDSADFIIQGEGDEAFYRLCRDIFDGLANQRVIKMSMPSLKNVELPYKFYTDDDIKNRYIYVEASRGCPFECEFCLSSMDEKVRAFDIELFLSELELLWKRGARNFKFIDRTFNLNIKTANRLLDFFLEKEEMSPYFAHFEVVPDHFPESLKEKIASFPHGALQLEIGIQTLNPDIANNISRPLKLDKIKENIRFLENETNAHIHLDLIVGLPGESLESFGANLDELVSLSSCEIQIGILKKLSGTYINRHDIEYGMVYSDIPPYDVLQTSTLSFFDIQIMKRFSRFWDLTYNSGNFKESVKLIWQDESVFENFYAFSLWIYTQTDSTWQISLQRLGELLFKYLCEVKKIDAKDIAKNMLNDMMKLEGRVVPNYLKPYAENIEKNKKHGTSGFNKRQQ
ncbi:B12-binding domain-containing radical SAM protein [Sulfurimonas sp. RIFOXYB12_FULL_35_9]|uniref:B12-binding domain-containing radical SAM protein n=1 Tax=Sulfurimonas sp. RIFOXYB12_FULL_35_9 TaxID=1802256 RepID=UPI0008D4AE3C|nr:B12-binding domain-containing radical SAM protein [Sulfurimonas sp. RIFOXYB12_FULL_35_9]OHE04656.1 MAG: B12-binding domain-containing radical SAM protein [Sulfurimonas sp. RIFOXYB12_FULL_35_9]